MYQFFFTVIQNNGHNIYKFPSFDGNSKSTATIYPSLTDKNEGIKITNEKHSNCLLKVFLKMFVI